MDNQHRKISGYRELNQNEIDLMNEIKEMGKNIGDLIDKVKMVNLALADTEGGDELLTDSEAGRWQSIANTSLQQGIMALTRAVAKPKFF